MAITVQRNDWWVMIIDISKFNSFIIISSESKKEDIEAAEFHFQETNGFIALLLALSVASEECSLLIESKALQSIAFDLEDHIMDMLVEE